MIYREQCDESRPHLPHGHAKDYEDCWCAGVEAEKSLEFPPKAAAWFESVGRGMSGQ